MEKKIETSNYVMKEDVSYGTVKIANDVVAMIAALAACEIEGVNSMAGNVGNNLLSKVGIKNTSKGVRVFVEGMKVRADVAIVIDYGYSIPLVSSKVQDKVAQAIETMTGLTVTDVNVKIAGVNLQK